MHAATFGSGDRRSPISSASSNAAARAARGRSARRPGPHWTEGDVRATLAAQSSDTLVGHNHEVGAVRRMTTDGEATRAIEACRRAGLPVIDEGDCTCQLAGRLVVVARADRLEVVWPYDRRCPIHGTQELRAPARTAQSPPGRSQAARPAWTTREAGAR